MASGVYQLPLFTGVPSMALLREMARSGDVDAMLGRALKVCLLPLARGAFSLPSFFSCAMLRCVLV